MAVFYILGCILFLSNMCEMRPQYDRHHPFRSQPIIESSALENWAYEEPGPFEPPTPLNDHSSLRYIEMNDQPSISDNEFNDEVEDIQTMYPPRNKDALYYEKESHENLQMPPRQIKSKQRNSTGGHVVKMEDGTLRWVQPVNYQIPSYHQPMPSYQALASRAGDNVSERRDTRGEIIFPGPNSAEKRFVPPVGKLGPACALGSTFCEDLDPNIVYPTAHVTKELEESAGVFNELFGSDVTYTVNVTQRIDSNDESSICASQEYVVYPKLAQNDNSDWRFIVNTEKYQQGIRIERCINPDDTPCQFTDQFPLGYTTSCKQKYIYRKLVSLKDNGETFSDTFRIPSCCSCTVKANVGTRMGGPQTSAKLKR